MRGHREWYGSWRTIPAPEACGWLFRCLLPVEGSCTWPLPRVCIHPWAEWPYRAKQSTRSATWARPLVAAIVGILQHNGVSKVVRPDGYCDAYSFTSIGEREGEQLQNKFPLWVISSSSTGDKETEPPRPMWALM